MANNTKTSVKMFGLQRTCTNVVLKGIKANYHVISRERNREWKHGTIGRSGNDIPVVVCCFREPLAWLVSMYHWSFSGDRHGCPHFRKSMSFVDFLESRHYDWPSPLLRWNEINRHYLKWLVDHPDQGIAVRSEDMMSPADARKQYLRIGEHFGLQRRSKHVHVFRRRVNNVQQLQIRPMDFGYYANRTYLDAYTPRQRSEIAANVDAWVLNQLNYMKYISADCTDCGSVNQEGASTNEFARVIDQ